MAGEVGPSGPGYPGTWAEFRAWFPDEEACAGYVERLDLAFEKVAGSKGVGLHAEKCPDHRGTSAGDHTVTASFSESDRQA